MTDSQKKLFGFLNIYKPVGMTSHDVVAFLRRLTKIRQIGHTGTLDPFAEGVLPICIGKATRLIEYLEDDKEYMATVQFGADTTTYDIEGEKTFTSDLKVEQVDVENALKSFEGEIQQLPPIFSAIKIKGKKLYEYAREGKDVEIQPRTVTIENIELKKFDKNLQQAEILIKCSKGTYIRSIAYDLGRILKSGAHLIKLVRTQAGRFLVENSVQLENLEVVSNLINPVDMLNLPQLNVDSEELDQISHGISIANRLDYFIQNGNFISLTYNNNVAAVGQLDGSKIKIKKVFL